MVLSFAIFSAFLVTDAGQTQAPTPTEHRIERILEIFYLNPQYRSPYDSIELQGSELRISVWRGLPPDPQPDRIECQGYRWLLGGRGEKMGRGASEVFREFPNLQSIQLDLVDVEFDVSSVDGRGKLKKESRPKHYLRLKLHRSEIEKFRIEPTQLKSQLLRDQETCLGIGRRLKIEKRINL